MIKKSLKYYYKTDIRIKLSIVSILIYKLLDNLNSNYSTKYLNQSKTLLNNKISSKDKIKIYVRDKYHLFNLKIYCVNLILKKTIKKNLFIYSTYSNNMGFFNQNQIYKKN